MHKKKITPTGALLYVFLTVVLVFMMIPFVWLLISSLRPNADLFNEPFAVPKTLSFENFRAVMESHPMLLYFANSVAIATIATVIAVGAATLAAYAMQQRFLTRKSLTVLFSMCLFIPTNAFMVPYYVMINKIGLYDNVLGIALVYAGVNLPMSFMVIKGYMDTIPGELLESAKIDGATAGQSFWKIILPVSKPGIVTACIFLVINSWNELLFANLLNQSDSSRTIQVAIRSFLTTFEAIRDGIRNLVDWNQEGFEEPLLFSSAVEALVFLETETVDVVLTDLYMPVLNGIEFIRMLREQNQVCEVIILTGHERFELAREAIALGVKQYLLKPVTGQTLLTELHKVSREIQERMRLKDWVDIAKKKLHDYLPVIQNQFWNDLLLGNLIELKKIKERAEEAEISIPESEMTCLAVQRKGEQLERDRITREMALRELTEEILGEKYLGALFYNGMEMVICKGRISRDYVEILNESVKHNFGYSISIGVSTAQKDATNLRNLAREAMDAVQSIHEEDVISYIYYRDIENKKKERVEYPYEEERRILHEIRFQRLPDRNLLRKFLEKLLPPRYSVEKSKMLLLQFLLALVRMADELEIDVATEFGKAEASIESLQKVEEALERMITRMVSEKEKMSRRYTEILVQSARNYIQEHFADEELSAGKIAEAVGVTPNYLSRIFKSITGDTCVSFLGKVRLDEAKKLLRDSSFKSYEVAEAVGYKNPNYFGAMFKRYTGYTPKEYREASYEDKN